MSKKNKYTNVYKKDLLRSVKGNVSEQGNIFWTRVIIEMQAKYPDLYFSTELLRSQYRRMTSDAVRQHDKRRHDANAGRESLEDRLLYEIKKKRDIGWLVRRLAEDEDAIIAAATRLTFKGYSGVSIWVEDGITYIQNITKKPRAGSQHVTDGDLYRGDIIRFGVVSDTHLGSNYEALDELYYFYNYAINQGVDTFFHAGDISDGHYTMRQTSIKDVHKVGFTDQLNYIVDNYPRFDGVTTYFITGNHDVTHMRNGFADIGDAISRMRDDLVYLGHNFAKYDLTPNLDMSLIHPTDGVSKSLSLKLQNMIDANKARRADIMLVGHYHKSVNIKYRDIYGYLLPSFQHQTGFMQDNNLVSDVAGMIFTIKVDDEGRMLSISTEYVDLSA